MATLLDRAELIFHLGVKLIEIKNKPELYPIFTIFLQRWLVIAQATPLLVDLINHLIFLFDNRVIYNFINNPIINNYINNPIINPIHNPINYFIDNIDLTAIDGINFANQVINLRTL